MRPVKVLIEKRKSRLSPAFLWTYLDPGSIRTTLFSADCAAIMVQLTLVYG